MHMHSGNWLSDVKKRDDHTFPARMAPGCQMAHFSQMSVSVRTPRRSRSQRSPSASPPASPRRARASSKAAPSNVVVEPPVPEHAWGWPIQYRQHHIPRARLEELRHEFDAVGDGAALAFSELQLHDEPAVFRCTQHKDPRINAFLKQTHQLPDWLDQAKLRHGQVVMLRYFQASGLALLYYSLIGGFSAPKIVRVLDSTGYLTKPNPDATWRRLNETLEMVADILDGEGAMLPGGRGWNTILKVRLMHSRVRLRLLAARGGSSWNTERDGLPVNQEDMVATLLSFSSNVLTAIKSVGAPHLTEADEQAFLHMFRYLGYLIGVAESNNPLVTENAAVARGAVESIVLHLTMEPDESSRVVANNVIAAATNRWPLFWSAGTHAACARRMLGAQLSDALHIPRGSWRQRIFAAFVFFVLLLLHTLVAPFLTADSALEKRARRILRQNVDKQLGRVPPIAKDSGGDSCPF